MHHNRDLAGVFLAALGMAIQPVGAADRPCPPDINCSSAVDVDDLIGVITEWGNSGTPADVNGSGTVDVDDLVTIVLAWGPCIFEYGAPRENAEAEQIGFEMLGPVGPLLLSDESYDRLDRDLALIRTRFPELTSEGHTPAWAADQLIVGVVQSADQGDYECLNAFYGVIDSDLIFSSAGTDFFVITVSGKINVEALANVYTALDEVTSASPNGLIGGQNFWTPAQLGGGVWQWEVDDGWHDCFDGCDCHRVYVVDINEAGVLTVVSVNQFGAPWCEFGS